MNYLLHPIIYKNSDCSELYIKYHNQWLNLDQKKLYNDPPCLPDLIMTGYFLCVSLSSYELYAYEINKDFSSQIINVYDLEDIKNFYSINVYDSFASINSFMQKYTKVIYPTELGLTILDNHLLKKYGLSGLYITYHEGSYINMINGHIVMQYNMPGSGWSLCKYSRDFKFYAYRYADEEKKTIFIADLDLLSKNSPNLREYPITPEEFETYYETIIIKQEIDKKFNVENEGEEVISEVNNVKNLVQEVQETKQHEKEEQVKSIIRRKMDKLEEKEQEINRIKKSLNDQINTKDELNKELKEMENMSVEDLLKKYGKMYEGVSTFRSSSYSCNYWASLPNMLTIS